MCCPTPQSIRIMLFNTLMLKIVRDKIVWGSTIPVAVYSADALKVSLQVSSRVVII